MLNRLVAAVWGAGALFIGAQAISVALGPKADASGWVMTAIFLAITLVCVWQAWREWQTLDTTTPRPIPPPAQRQQPAPSSTDAPGAWRGPDIPLETQIDQLKTAGLTLSHGRTIDELLTSWSRVDYESDPYLLLMVMYGSEVEAEPWGRVFCDRCWNFDMECLVQAGEYVQAFTQLLRITGQPHRVTQMSDDFDIDKETATISYLLDGQPRAITARVDSDWADPEAVVAFMRDLEEAIADGRHFWAADNGQASVLVFLTDAKAAKINTLRADLLQRYTAD